MIQFQIFSPILDPYFITFYHHLGPNRVPTYQILGSFIRKKMQIDPYQILLQQNMIILLIHSIWINKIVIQRILRQKILIIQYTKYSLKESWLFIQQNMH